MIIYINVEHHTPEQSRIVGHILVAEINSSHNQGQFQEQLRKHLVELAAAHMLAE